MRIYPVTLFLFLVGSLLLTNISAQADLATVYFKDGKVSTVEFVGVDRASLLWKRSASDRDIQKTMRSEVDKVNFPTTEAWRKAEAARESGRLGEALRYYEEVIADPAGNYFPFPGNFVSLSKERILQCYRLQLSAAKIAEQAKVVREEFFHLPPELNRVEPETAAWSAMAQEDWEGALKAIQELEAPGPEAYYLEGRALEALGKKSEAVSAYAGAYVLNFGGASNLTREALRRSSKLVFEIGDPDRIAQLQAQVKLYRDLYGKGSLWEGAPEQLASLADAEIKPLGEAQNEMEKPTEPTSETGPVVSDSAAVATLEPAENRPFLLAEELEDRVYLIGRKKEILTIEGGVTKEGKSYRYDGTGGHIQLEPVELDTLFLRIRLSILPEESNAVLANVIPKDRGGGFSLYLKDGNLMMDWAAKGEEVLTTNLASVELDKLNHIEIIFRTTGERETFVGRNKYSSQVPEGGLGLKQEGVLTIGDSENLFSGEELPPFKGVLQHFSLETDKNSTIAGSKVKKRFGKSVFLLPPPPESSPPSPQE